MPTIHTTEFGQDFVIEFDYRITFRGYPAKLNAAPEDCYPGEAPEYEYDLTALYRDIPAPSAPDRARIEAIQGPISDERWENGWLAPWRKRVEKQAVYTAPLDVPSWLKDQIETWLCESDDVMEIICERKSEDA